MWTEDVERGATYPRTVVVLAASVIAVSFIGFFVGVRESATEGAEGHPTRLQVDSALVAPALSYAQLREKSRTAPTTQAEALRKIAAVPSEDGNRDGERTYTDVLARSNLRAYDGAPPMVPHPIPIRGDLPCLTCHDQGLVVGSLRAPAVSHAKLTNCVQCHVPANGPFPDGFPADVEPIAPNEFSGLAAAHQSPRAWDGAPPVVPHSTWMRQECDSCHGPSGAPGIRTTHPLRQNCLQCHATSAILENRPMEQLPFGSELLR